MHNMSFFTILETLLIGPLKLLFEIIFTIANQFIGHPGLSIIVLSLVMNILVLPLYRRADAMQEESRDTEAKLREGVAHIKKTFSGDERMMILQTYYRQNHYRPTDALNGSVSLLLEIPFFMAAYQFLSHVQILNGVSLGPIRDLGAPDGLLVIGSLTINLLPILMTAINFVSSAIYLKGFPLKTKLQLYGMALFFLVFLYTSPACLVFYWTLNNLFSLVKTIFYKLKNPRKILGYLTFGLGLAVLAFGLFFYHTHSVKRKVFILGIGLLLELPLLLPVLKARLPLPKETAQVKPDRRLFLLGALFLTILVGLLIPSTFIAESPQEYVDISYFHNPLWYVVSALCLSAGTFLVWMGVFYWLAKPKGKVFFQRLVWVLCGVMVVNYMFFGTKLGIISSTLQYEGGMEFSRGEQLLNLAILAAVALLMYLFARKQTRSTGAVLLTAIIALGGMSAVNLVKIKRSVDEISVEKANEMPGFQLSKTGKNVVVLMLDRAMGEYVPYLINEKPELQEKFDGFTYYSNTISFGGCTNFATPALLGGYEYTPVELNKRSDELLVDKQNEALKVMPVLFADNDYKVTVCDPVYANYQWIPDLSIFDDDPRISAYITKGKFGDTAQKEQTILNNRRNFFVFSVMKSMPLCLQPIIYNDGLYNQSAYDSEEAVYSGQTIESISRSTGISAVFMDCYHVLDNLPEMTTVSKDGTNTYLFLSNDTTHEPILLQEPEYKPSQVVDNTAFDAANTSRFTVDGRTLLVEEPRQMVHYQSNMAAMLLLGEWFDYLRENGVYDNTRIILVSDHGSDRGQLEELMADPSDGLKNLEFYFPLLMVKDFDSHSFTTSREFMTNADVPTLATAGLIENPTNPFTGKAINSDEKTAHDQFIIRSRKWKIAENNGTTFLPAQWASVSDDLWNLDNWTFYDEETVLDRHAAP